MPRNLALFVFLLGLVSTAQQPQDKTPVPTDPEASTKASELSRDYRKSAITALSSITDWNSRAMEISSPSCTSYSSGSRLVNRSCAEREVDAEAKAEKDVKLTRVDVTTSADKFLQQRLEIYLEAVKPLNYLNSGRISGAPKPDETNLKTRAACGRLIAKSLDEGSTAVFDEHPELRCE